MLPQALAGESESVEALRERSLQAKASQQHEALQMAVPPQLVSPEPLVPLAPPFSKFVNCLLDTAASSANCAWVQVISPRPKRTTSASTRVEGGNVGCDGGARSPVCPHVSPVMMCRPMVVTGCLLLISWVKVIERAI